MSFPFIGPEDEGDQKTSNEPSLVIYIPPNYFTAYKSCRNVTLAKALTCLGRVLFKCATSVVFNNQLNALVIYSKCREDEFAKMLDQCCQSKCNCQSLRPAYRVELPRNIVWDFVSFRIMFPK